MEGIVPIYAHNAGCDFHRIIMPYRYLGVKLEKLNGVKFEDIVKDTKCIVFNRTPKQSILPYLMLKQKHDFKIIVDLDDYWELHPKHSLLAHWTKTKTKEQIQMALMNADAVTVTTKLLADVVRPLNKNVHVIPNALPFGYEQFTAKKVDSELFRVMYAGGGSHFWDVKVLEYALRKINNNPQFSNSRFIFAGYAEQEKQSGRIESVLGLNGKFKLYQRKDMLKLNEYMNHYNHADLSLVPLEANNFNRYKSNLKIIESGTKFVPAICSYTEPYLNDVDKNVVMYAKNTSEWYEKIKYCMQNPSFVLEKGLALGAHVREHYDLLKVNQYRKQLISHLTK